MPDAFPEPTPGPSLADLRKKQGVSQQDLAARMGVHRVTLNKLEGAAEVDPIKAARYRRALLDLVDEAIAGTSQAATA